MPRYAAAAVTATLSTCDLRSTISHDIKLNQGAAAQANKKRLQHVFDSAEKLIERPIGQDGSSRGIVQFIGTQEDMPLYMVETGRYARRNEHPDGKSIELDDKDGASEDEQESPLQGTPEFGSDSPLTSLSTSSTAAQAYLSTFTAQTTHVVHSDDIERTHHDLIQDTSTSFFDEQDKALVLDVSFTDESFLPGLCMPKAGDKGMSKALKVEVFINGQLVDVGVVNEAEGRRLAVQIVEKNKIRFSGTRIHRQIEKPWIYSGIHHRSGTPDSTNNIVEQLWNNIARALLDEAETRGVNKYGEFSPSGQYLAALSSLCLPEYLNGYEALAIMDVVMTIGYGRKHGPDTPYLTKPTRLVDKVYARRTDLTKDMPSELPERSLSASYISEPPVATTLAHAPAGAAVAKGVSGGSRNDDIDLMRELGLESDGLWDKNIISRYDNTRGHGGKSGRTLRQRLGDLKKMNRKNLTLELSKMKDDLNVDPSPRKKQRMDSGVELDAEFETYMTAYATTPSTSMKAPEMPSYPDRFLHGNGAIAINDEDQQDTLNNAAGVQSRSVLFADSMGSMPQTPSRASRASALANSPTFTPVKLPKPRGVPTQFSKAQKVDSNGSPIAPAPQPDLEQGHATPNKPMTEINSKSGKGSVQEQAVQEALENFTVPDVCMNSSVTYDEDPSIARQIGKARGGEFRENTLLVGMRFVVL